MCPIHVQIYSANLLAPSFICSAHRSGFRKFRLKWFRNWISEEKVHLSITGSTNEGKSQVDQELNDFKDHDNCATKVKAEPPAQGSE